MPLDASSKERLIAGWLGMQSAAPGSREYDEPVGGFALTIDEAGTGRKWFVHADCFPDSMRARMSNPQSWGP
jgi:hypothetical protein